MSAGSDALTGISALSPDQQARLERAWGDWYGVLVLCLTAHFSLFVVRERLTRSFEGESLTNSPETNERPNESAKTH